MFGLGQHPRARQSRSPLVPNPPSGYAAGWKAAGHGQHPSDQIGAFDGQMLTQYPTNIPGVQLKGGTEGMRSNWYYPSMTSIPLGSIQQTTRPNNITSGQRWGSQYSGPIGPATAQAMRANVTTAQVRQSGLAAMYWAQGLLTRPL